MATTTPPDKRPYRLASAPGEERAYTSGDFRYTYRHIGWHGQSGAFYALGEDPSRHEPGSFAPLWLQVGSEPIIEPDAEPDSVEFLDEDLEVVSMAGRVLGSIQGRWEAATAAFNASFRNGLHDELQLAGACKDCNDEESGSEPDVKVVTLPDDHPLAQLARNALAPFHRLAEDLRAAVTPPAAQDAQERADPAEDTREALAARLAEEVRAKNAKPCRCSDAQDDPHTQGEHTNCNSRSEPCGTCHSCMSARKVVGQMPEPPADEPFVEVLQEPAEGAEIAKPRATGGIIAPPSTGIVITSQPGPTPAGLAAAVVDEIRQADKATRNRLGIA